MAEENIVLFGDSPTAGGQNEVKTFKIDKEYWSKHKRSKLFGLANRSDGIACNARDDRDLVNRMAPTWKMNNENGKLHGRLRIKPFGSLQYIPGPEYDPVKLETLHKHEHSPEPILSFRRNKDEEGKTGPISPILAKSILDYDLPLFETNKKKSTDEHDILTPGQLVTKLKDLRTSNIGPGTYNQRTEYTTVFPTSSRVILPKKKSITTPRKKLDLRTIKINNGDTPGVGRYDLVNDPRKISKSVTIGERRKLNKAESIAPASTKYHPEISYPFPGLAVVTPNQPPVPRNDPIPDLVPRSKVNERIWKTYASSYSYPKKRPVSFGYKRTFTKTEIL